MDRRTFLRQGSWGLAGLALAPYGLSQDISLLVESANRAALSDQPLRTLAFGSCNRSTLSQDYWPLVARQQPDLWIWLGDTIYGDGLTMSERRQRYLRLKNDTDYAAFRSEVPVFGTWDDHDYASDNQDGRFAEKAQSREVLLDFLDIAPDAEVRAHQGVYQSYVFGPPGQRTQVILLDLRYNMDRSKNVKVLLGTEQWRWLERTLASIDADLLVIGSSLAVHSPVAALGLEGWIGYGAERKRLYSLLEATGIPAVLLSGDRHYAELSRIVLPSGLPVYEAMSSGLTHAVGVQLPHPGRLLAISGRKNFGLLRIEWDSSGPQVLMQIHSTEKLGVLGEARIDFRMT
jgi:alkaline phosphatase D